jgi:hypothetical protein
VTDGVAVVTQYIEFRHPTRAFPCPISHARLQLLGHLNMKSFVSVEEMFAGA